MTDNRVISNLFINVLNGSVLISLFSILGKKYCSEPQSRRGVVLDEYHLLSDY